MATRIPTQRGDVLILRTDKTFSIYAVGPVSHDDQQDFQGQAHVKHVTGLDAALAVARDSVEPGRRMFLRDIDTDDWYEISD